MSRHVETVLAVPQGRFELVRHPVRARSTLRAWDAADAYALRHLATIEPTGPVAVINDGFGALALGLHELEPTVVTDSVTARLGIEANRERNRLAPITVHAEVLDLPDGLGAAIIKIPKSLGLLEEQLHHLRPKLTEDTLVLGAGMVKSIHTSTLDLFQSILGPTTTSLAEQKARLIHCSLDPALTPPGNPWPRRWRHGGIVTSNRGGVFSAQSIDIGTRLLLEHLPAPTGSGGRIVDLGCGNGVVGATMAAADPDASLIFIDSSARAIDSARTSWAENHGDRLATFHPADRLVNVVDRGSVDLVINNPPFHDERAIGDATAWDMFVDAHAVLRAGGEIRVVGNRQLGHHARLRKIFGNCRTVASNRKFVVLAADRTAP